MTELPTGTVTFLFSDIEGSTRLLESLGDTYTGLLARHHRIIREAAAASGGAEVGTEGDSFFIAFASAPRALAAATTVQRALAAESWPPDAAIRVRIGLHTGDGQLSGGNYVGIDVHRAARVAAAAHGGQVLLSATTRALVEGAVPPGVSLRDLGEHRLRDLSRPEQLHEAVIEGLPSSFPPPRTVDSVPNNLPTQVSTFLGRERELAELEALLDRSRLLTLSGPGGTGKTRLSLALAARVADRYPDGVYFVPLASLADPRLVPSTIAHALGLPERGGRQPLDRLREHLRGRRTLLVLDNFEQVIGATSVVAELFAEAPRLSLLVTSRTVLRIYGEQEYPVPPLALPDPKHFGGAENLSQYAAVALFIERAMAVKPDFTVTNENAPAVAEICVRLDGLPLAIELAAARVRVLTPQAMLARLEHRLALLSQGARDLPARQQTLRGAIEWSYDMLPGEERLLFACLGVFVGRAKLDAVEAVCGPETAGDILDGLSALTEQSLVRQVAGTDGEPRFGMLETIREFALERLVETDRAAAVRRRHAEVATALVESARRQLLGSEKRDWLDRLEEAHDDLRAALGWTLEQDEAALALRLSAGLWRFWQMRGYLSEGYEWVSRALALPQTAELRQLRADTLEAQGGLAWWMGDLAATRLAYEACLTLRRELGDPGALAEALYNLSFTESFRVSGANADIQHGFKLVEEALRLYEDTGDRAGVAKAKWSLSNIGWANGDLALARRYGEEAATMFRELDDQFMLGWAQYDLGLVAIRERQLGEAHELISEALEIFSSAHDVSGYTLVLDAFAALADALGQRERAARLSGAVDALERSSGTGLNQHNRHLLGFDVDALRADASLREAWLAGSQLGLDEVVADALAAEGRPPQDGAARSRRGKMTKA